MTDNSPTQPTLSREVFISYASQDKPVADAACDALERAGVACWIAPRNVTPGEFYAESIVHAIDSTKVIVLVLSKNAADSQHVLSEVERARSRRHPVVSFRLDTAPLPAGLEYFLNTSQWLDASATGVDRALPRLVDAVKSALAQPSAAARVSPSPRAASKANRAPRRVLVTLTAIVVAALAYFAVDRVWLTKHAPAEQPATTAAPPTATISDKSIAVLPFTDMSEKHDQEFMSDGLAEELLNLLAQAPGLKVIARTSSFAFKGKAVDIAEIAKRLNVAHVLEGSVRKSGNKIRITAQLIRTADSTHLWSETFDRPLKDIFAVQDEIAGAIVQALRIRLAGGELNRRKGGTQNLEAYQLYLRAVNAQNQNTKASLDAAGDYLEQAIKIDPSYGLAWSALADTFSVKADNGFLAATKGYERARELAQHALQLSPDLAYANARLQYIHQAFDWDWAAADAEGKRALAIDPTNPWVFLFNGRLSSTLGRWEEAERQFRAALARDPLNPYTIWNLGSTYYLAGRLDDSEGTYRRLLELAPDFGWTRPYLAKTLLVQGRPDAALAMVQQTVDEGGGCCISP
jgi:TolB-like protein/Tfp pilus assembly protein PilF